MKLMKLPNLLTVILGSLVMLQTARAQSPQPSQTPTVPLKTKTENYQKQFDQALDKLNNDLGTYAQMECDNPDLIPAAQMVSADLVMFSRIYKAMPLPISKLGTRDIELSYGMLDLVDSVTSAKEKCFLKDLPKDDPNNSKS